MNLEHRCLRFCLDFYQSGDHPSGQPATDRGSPPRRVTPETSQCSLHGHFSVAPSITPVTPSIPLPVLMGWRGKINTKTLKTETEGTRNTKYPGFPPTPHHVNIRCRLSVVSRKTRFNHHVGSEKSGIPTGILENAEITPQGQRTTDNKQRTGPL
jgi:hypothetical protein